MIKLFWAPMSKCFAALILSVALLGCGSNGSNSSFNKLSETNHPVTANFGTDKIETWCSSFFGINTYAPDYNYGPVVQANCTKAYYDEVKTRLQVYYDIARIPFAQCENQFYTERCDDPEYLEDMAIEYFNIPNHEHISL